MDKLKNSKLYNMLWFMFGSLSFGFTSLIFTIIITRIINVEVAGKFSFAFAVACTFYVVGVYFGRTFQITDTTNKYSDTDYIYNRVTTCIIMLFMTIIFCIFKGYKDDKILLIMLLVIYRGIDAFLDSIHGVIQKKDKIYKLGKLTFYRTICLIIVFFTVCSISKNIILTCTCLLITDILFIFLFDYRLAKKYIVKSKYNGIKNLSLMIEGATTFLFSFFAIIILNSPKYSIDNYSNNTIQGIFGIIFMPSSFLSLVSLYIINPFINEITNLVTKKDKKLLTKKIIEITIFILFIGLLVLIVGYYLGIPILYYIYGIELNKYKRQLMYILTASVFYSIYCLLSTVLIAMRKNLPQLISLFVVTIIAIITSNILVFKYSIVGASYAYLITMIIQTTIYIIITIFYVSKINAEKRVAVRLMGGLGNQMFEYAALRAISLKYNAKAIVDTTGITNKTHNVYGLNHCNLPEEVIVRKEKKSFKALISYLLYGLDWILFKKIKNGSKVYDIIQPILNNGGIICIPENYIEINELTNEYNYMVGYFQNSKYIKGYEKQIREELQIQDVFKGKNKKVYEEILNNNSVCVHIRRGDYIGSDFQVCTNEYYYEAINQMNNKTKKAKYYIFSDDINWIKKNMDFGKNDVTFIDWKNNQYEDLKLMSGCKNFIMSNSSFSYMAQFLSYNNKKIVIAPNKWNANSEGKEEIYDDSWIIIEV